jgi:transposase
MLGKRPAQRSLFEAGVQYPKLVSEESFYRFLARQRQELFRDEDYAGLYHAKLGRPSVAPSLLATALVLQTYARASDEEAAERAAYDLRWKIALGLDLEDIPFAKSTLQLFRAQLILKEEVGAIFARSLRLARKRGHLKGRMRLAVDTTNILGRGATKDTYNLLRDGIVLVMRQLARLDEVEVEEWAAGRELGCYVSGSSLKGEAELDWDSAEARRRFLGEIVADADRLLEAVREGRAKLKEGSPEDAELAEAAQLLAQVLTQDIERPQDGPVLREGVAKDRMPSVHDPEVRHGHKSANKRFDGSKAQIAVDIESQIITAVEVLAGNAPDNEGVLGLVEAAEKASEAEVAETVGDCAFGDGKTRAAFAEAGRKLVAKVAVTRNGGLFPKTDFRIDLEAQTCVCPAGQSGNGHYHKAARDNDEAPQVRQLRSFVFAAATCAACPLRPQCVRGKGGRTVQVHPHEALLQAARAFQHSPESQPYRADRQVVEHRLARLVQLGIRQARYIGRTKTLFQVLMAATVANLTLIAALEATTGGGSSPDSPVAASLRLVLTLLVGLTSALVAWTAPHWPSSRQLPLARPSLPRSHCPSGYPSRLAKTAGFRLDF